MAEPIDKYIIVVTKNSAVKVLFECRVNHVTPF